MIKLLIIADDFTGALDTGVKLAEKGAVTNVVTGDKQDFDYMGKCKEEVLVVNAESRHMTAAEAYKAVYEIVRKAKAAGVECIIKKTDSGLRGNIGSELAAALDASGEQALHFIPAFPKMHRVTKKGIHYIDGVPVHESVFGKDPFEPVTTSDVTEIIGMQSGVPVLLSNAHNELLSPAVPSIILYDAEQDEELEAIGRKLTENGKLHVAAGCAGLASALPSLLKLGGKEPVMPCLNENFLVMCGSVNPVTQKQLDYAQTCGFTRIRMTPEQKLKEGYLKTPDGEAAIENWMKILKDTGRCIIDTNDLADGGETSSYAQMKNMSSEMMRKEIASNLGYVLKRFMEKGVECTVMITGGDSLMGFMKQIEVNEITPVCELAPGIVLSSYKMNGESHNIITKSGGFGNETLLADLADQIARKKAKN